MSAPAHTLAEFERELAPELAAPHGDDKAKRKSNGHDRQGKPNGTTADDAAVMQRFEALRPATLRTAIRYGVPKGDRSATFQSVVQQLAAKGWAAADIIALFRLFPDGIAAKMLTEGHELEREVERSLESTGVDPAADADSAPPLSEESLALDFSARHAERLRYVDAFGKWFEWDGRCWRIDATLAVVAHARRICRETAARLPETVAAKHGRSLTRAATVAAVERLARADRRHAETVEPWDRDPHLLNTPGGIVNLSNGQLMPHRAACMMTKLTGVTPAATAECPLWRQFLDVIMNGDRELIDFLPRFYGYALTGYTSEQVFAFNYGTGANGKSVFINTMAGIFGDYFRNAPTETFMLATGERHPTEVANLRGARLVAASETAEGKRWNETRIKELTGGEKVSARFMRQDFFEFVPQFKLVVSGNHKPRLHSVDEAIRRRFLLVPFTVTIAPERRDRQLTAKLKREWPGILRWLIDGAVAWCQESRKGGSGLKVPDVIRAATEDYLRSEDVFGLWLDERCSIELAAAESFKNLYDDYKVWAEGRNEYVVSAKAFAQILMERPEGFAREHRRSGPVYVGLRLIAFANRRYERRYTTDWRDA